MEKNKSAKYIADIIINIVIVVSTVLATVLYFFGGPDNLGSQGLDCFKYFTTDSNVVAAVASLLYVIFRWKGNVPKWVRVFKFVGTVAVTLTFLTVVFFLAPTRAIFSGGGLQVALIFFKGNVFVLHFSTPVLSIISTCFLEKDMPITKKQALWRLVPTAVYAAVYAIMVIVVKRWNDWYGFTFGGRFELAPVAIFGMLLVTLAIALVERLIRNKKIK